MPLYRLYCNKCDTFKQRLLKIEELDSVTCKVCDTKLVREAEPPKTEVLEVLDNGIMVKRLERPQKIEELVRERNKKKED